MVVGKPDFNLNSYGITYFHKGEDSIDEVDESRDDVKVDSKIGGTPVPINPTPKELADVEMNRKLNSGNTKMPHNTGASRFILPAKKPKHEVNIKDLEESKEVTSRAAPMTDAERAAGHTKDTEHVFLAEQDPKTLSFDQKKLLQDVHDSKPAKPKPDPITGRTPEKRGKYPTEGVVANSGFVSLGHSKDIDDKKRQYNPHTDKVNPDDVGSGDGKNSPFKLQPGITPKDRNPQGAKIHEAKDPEKEEEERKMRGQDKVERKRGKTGKKMVGDAPPEVKNTVERHHEGKTVKVGVGSKENPNQAKDVYDERDGVGAVYHEDKEENDTTRPTGVVAKPGKPLNTINNKDNPRLSAHNEEMNKFLRSTKYTKEQKREYNKIPTREDGRDDHDARSAFVRNLTGKQSKTQEKVAQTEKEKIAEKEQDIKDRLTDMKSRSDKRWEEGLKERKRYTSDANQKKITPTGDKFKIPTGKKQEAYQGIKPKKGKYDKHGDPTDETPDSITSTDDKAGRDARRLGIATTLHGIKDPKKREEKRRVITGEKSQEELDAKIERAYDTTVRRAKEVISTNAKRGIGKKKKETSKKKVEPAKKKKVPKEGDLTPAQIKAYKKEREAAKKDVKTKSNDIIMDTIIMKLNLMKDSKDGKQSKDGLKPKKSKTSEIWVTAQDLDKSASETIFKALSLKLDLMKGERSDKWDDEEKDNDYRKQHPGSGGRRRRDDTPPNPPNNPRAPRGAKDYGNAPKRRDDDDDHDNKRGDPVDRDLNPKRDEGHEPRPRRPRPSKESRPREYEGKESRPIKDHDFTTWGAEGKKPVSSKPKTQKIVNNQRLTQDDISDSDSFETKQRKFHAIANQHHAAFADPEGIMARATGRTRKPNPRALQEERSGALQDDDLKASEKLKSQAEETIFKALSLKLDLMNKKDVWDKNDKKRTKINQGIKDDVGGNTAEHDLVDLLSEVIGKKTGNVDGSRRAVQAALSGKKGRVGNTIVQIDGDEAPFKKKKPKKF